jgi:hypothetical protein
MSLRPWIECASLHPDVLKDTTETDIFALDLGPLADDTGTVAKVYRDPESFFRASYLTTGLKSLLEDVLKRLSGKGGSPVLKLLTPFGGGKSHAMAALMHAARDRKALNSIPEGKRLPDPGEVRVAVIDGQFFNAQKGKEAEGVRVQTLWGWIGLRLGGKKGYEQLKENDDTRVAPGGDELLKLFGDKANLILLDEVLEYLINAGGVKVLNTDLREQTLTFLKELTVAASNAPRTMVVMALPSSQPIQTLQHTQLLSTLDHFVGRKDDLREPVEGDEVLKVIQRRLLEKMPEPAVADEVGNAFQGIVTQMRKAYATSSADEQQAEEEGIALRKRIRDAYPFHPALLDLMRQRWAALPEYQRTRGALRFLAGCLRVQRQGEKSGVILGPADVPLSDPIVKRALVKELRLMNRFDAAFEADLIGSHARARRIDQRRAKENASEVGKNVAQRLATAIFLYSFGGLRREVGGSADVLPPGVTEQELLASCVGPDIDSLTAKACLAELRQQCLYLHFDGVRYCFKQDPNVTLLIEQEADAVARDEKQVTVKIKEMLEQRVSGHHGAVVWPADSTAIPDKQPRFQMALLPLDFSAKPGKEQDAVARDLIEKCGNAPRSYRNGLGLATPAAEQVEALRREVRYLLAIDRVKKNAKKLNLTKEQSEELREREATHASAAESGFLKLYTEVWFPRVTNGVIGIEKVAVGGRPLQTTLNERRQAMIFERLMELVMQIQKRLFDTLSPQKIIELFKLGEGTPPRVGIAASEVVDGFYSFLGFTRIVSDAAIRRALVRGIKDGNLAFTTGKPPTLGANGRLQVSWDKVRFETILAEDEVDLDSGFVMLPSGLPTTPAPRLPEEREPSRERAQEPPPGETPITQPPVTGAGSVVLTFRADRNALFQAWPALANLSDLAGEVSVTVTATPDKPMDKSKLANGVYEPLRELGLLEE